MNAGRTLGAVAAGHSATVEAAAHALREGGNAFDAVIAAHWAASVAEPVLTSLGGGGFLIAQPHDAPARVYDFFAQTPRRKRPAQDIDFYPILADFGTTRQEFHIGYGSVATPGTVRGLFQIHHDLAELPMAALVEPAVQLARDGLTVNQLQAYILDVVRPIYLASPAARQRFASRRNPERLLGQGEILRMPELADTLLGLVEERDRLFYEGDIAATIGRTCQSAGGHLSREDLAAYRVRVREPLRRAYRDARLLTNPPPSSGGLLIAFALQLLEELHAADTAIDCVAGLVQLAETMRVTNEARLSAMGEGLLDEHLLEPGLVRLYLDEIRARPPAVRGTTHISIIDRAGNVAALTTSNGEGCGHLLGSTGIMLNNMLGEADLNPGGFHRWQENRRMTSMMAPSILHLADGTCVALGSGGSNRIRSALLQVLLKLVDLRLPLEEAIALPRIHYENGLLNIEGGFDEGVYAELQKQFPNTSCWPGSNLFFGGVHAVALGRDGFACSGDQRRGGVAEMIR
jgi:gamma-glutamyltranspeptidase/glutathione hydrolase